MNNSLGELARKDAGAAFDYAKCQAKHLAAVTAYGAARQKAIEANAGIGGEIDAAP